MLNAGLNYKIQKNVLALQKNIFKRTLNIKTWKLCFSSFVLRVLTETEMYKA